MKQIVDTLTFLTDPNSVPAFLFILSHYSDWFINDGVIYTSLCAMIDGTTTDAKEKDRIKWIKSSVGGRGHLQRMVFAFNFVALTSDLGIKPALVAEDVQLWSKHYSHVTFTSSGVLSWGNLINIFQLGTRRKSLLNNLRPLERQKKSSGLQLINWNFQRKSDPCRMPIAKEQ